MQRDVRLTLSLDRAVWLALLRLVKEKEEYWLAKLSAPRLSEVLKHSYRIARARWGGAREKLEAKINEL